MGGRISKGWPAPEEVVALLEGLSGTDKLSHDTGLSDVSQDDHHTGHIPVTYSNVMTGDETFAYLKGDHLRCFLDPGGADRDFDPAGAFPLGFKVEVINVGGAFNIIFDSTGSAQVVTSGAMGTFIYGGGTTWW